MICEIPDSPSSDFISSLFLKLNVGNLAAITKLQRVQQELLKPETSKLKPVKGANKIRKAVEKRVGAGYEGA